MRLKLLFVMMLFVVSVFSLSIYDIQFTDNPNGDSPYEGQTVTVEGIVTGAGFSGDKFFMSDPEGGAWSGIYVYNTSQSGIEIGDLVEVTGEVQEYYDFTELSYVSVTILSSGNELPEPVIATTNEIATEEKYEGVFVRVEDVTVTSNPNNYNEFNVSDGSGNCQVDDGFGYYANPDIGDDFYYLQGLVDYNYSTFAINSRFAADVVKVGPPYVENIWTDPIYPIISEEFNVMAQVMDFDKSIEEVILQYKLNSETEFEETNMSLIDGQTDQYFATIIAPDSTHQVMQVRIFARDDNNENFISEQQEIEFYGPTPFIENIDIITPAANEDLNVYADLIDLNGEIDIAELHYKKDFIDKTYVIEGENINDDNYRFSIPSQKGGTTIQFFIYVQDNENLYSQTDWFEYTYPIESHKAYLKIPPRPFNPKIGETIEIKFGTKSYDKAIVRIYNSEGKLVATPFNDFINNSSGIKSIFWDGRDKEHKRQPIGLYIAFLEVFQSGSGKKETAKAPIVIGAPLK